MSSREQYQVPNSQGFTTGASNNDGNSGGSSVMWYTCGDCAVRVPLEKGAPIRCQKCGARVLYKERTKRYVFLAYPIEDSELVGEKNLVLTTVWG